MSIVNLNGRVGLITGVANDKSIAYGVAQACRIAGAEVAVTYQNEKTAKYTQPLSEMLDAKIFAHCDVSEPGSMERVFEEIEKTYGRLDFVLHSMAFAPMNDLHGSIIDCSQDGFAKSMDISVHSLIRMAKLAKPLMKEGGSIVTMTYLGADRVVENYGVMGLCKAALESATRYLAHEMGADGIRVNAVSPGPMMTRAASGINHFDELMEKAVSRSPLHRLATTENVGNLTAFLFSDASAAMTGSTIYVDAGYHIEA